MPIDEVWKEWQADPEIAKHVAEREKRHAEGVQRNLRDVQPVLDDLHRLGFEGAAIDDIFRSHAPTPTVLTEALLSWIPRVDNRNIKDAMICSLAASTTPFDGRPLVAAFANDDLDGLLRWPIANTLACANVTGINDWLIETVRRPVQGREMLVLALAKHVPSEISLPILRSLLDELPGYVAEALRKIGGREELEALKSRLPVVAKTWVRKEFEKTIRAIERRLQKSKD